MKYGFLITGVAVAALVAGGASATIHKSHHKSHMRGTDMYAAPSQPIPYAQLDSYLAAKPSQRASMGDSGASMGSNPAPAAAAPATGAGDQMGNMSSGSMSASPPATGDTGAAATPPAPETTQGAPDGSSTPPPK
jgi:hypothetical protein